MDLHGSISAIFCVDLEGKVNEFDDEFYENK